MHSCPHTGPASAAPPQEAPAVEARSPPGLNSLRGTFWGLKGTHQPQSVPSLVASLALRWAVNAGHRQEAFPPSPSPRCCPEDLPEEQGTPLLGPFALSLVAAADTRVESDDSRRPSPRPGQERALLARGAHAAGARFLAAEPGHHLGSGTSRGL